MMQMVCIMLLKELIFEDELKQMINYFANKERIEYYKKTFGYKTTNQVLVKDYGEGHFGCSGHNKDLNIDTNPNYMVITDGKTNEGKKYSWDYIAKEVDKIIDGNKSPEQMSLF